MDHEFARMLVDVRLLQAERLLEWMLGGLDLEAGEAVSCAMGAVRDARSVISGLSSEGSQADTKSA